MKLLFCLILLINSSALADFSEQGSFKFESRTFVDDKNPDTFDNNLALAVDMEFKYEKSFQQHKFQFFTRNDTKDSTRNISYLKDAYLGLNFNNVEVLAGYQIFNWSTTEAFHPVDVINSRNYDSDTESIERMGLPALTITYLFDTGSVSLINYTDVIVPYFPGSSNRLNFLGGALQLGTPLVLKKDETISDSLKAPQIALKFDKSFDSSDLSITYLDHIDTTQPSFVLSGLSLLPVFIQKNQIGVTYQYAINDSLIKVEAAHKDFKNDITTAYGTNNQLDHSDIAVGFEYSYNHKKGPTSTFIIEYDKLLGQPKEESLQLSIFENDILLGYRLAINDIKSKELFIGLINDLYLTESITSFSYSQRLTDVWKINFSFRGTHSPTSANTLLNSSHGNIQTNLNITRYF